MQKAQDLLQHSIEITERLGFKDTTADTQAGWALVQAEVGNASKAREFALASSSQGRGRSNLEFAAIAFAMAGDAPHAEAIVNDLSTVIPRTRFCTAYTRPPFRPQLRSIAKLPSRPSMRFGRLGPTNSA